MSKRHFGSVRKLPSGRYQASYWFEGTRHLAEQTFRTKGDALAHLAKVETDVRRGVWIDPREGDVSVKSLSAQWLASNPAKRPDTRATDEYHLKCHILPSIQDRRIAEVTPRVLQQLVNEWSDKLAPKTVSRAYGVVRAMFTYAVQSDMLVRSPCRGIKLPRIEPRSRRLLTADDVATLAAATSEDYRAMVWLGSIVGLRFSEIAGLRVGRIDFLRRSISVAETITKDGKGGVVLGPPKSTASRRTVAIPLALTTLLSDHLTRLGLTGADTQALLFPAPGGGPLRYANWRNRVWLPACQRAGLTGVGVHDLRRLSATLLVNDGVDVKTAQTRLGHSDVRLTLELYAQAVDQADRAAANRLGRLLLGPPTQSRPRTAAKQPH
jgi:integrase